MLRTVRASILPFRGCLDDNWLFPGLVLRVPMKWVESLYKKFFEDKDTKRCLVVYSSSGGDKAVVVVTKS